MGKIKVTGAWLQENMDRIVRDCEVYLDEYNIDYQRRYLEKNIRNWWQNKKDLIELLSGHPAWVDEKLAVCKKSTCFRPFDVYRISENFDDLVSLLNVCGMTVFKDSIAEKAQLKSLCGVDLLRHCDNNLITQEYINATEIIFTRLRDMHITLKTRPKLGQKLQRFVGQLCVELGIDTHECYNKLYAVFADSCSPIEIDYNVMLSVHPADYLSMGIVRSGINKIPSCYHLGSSAGYNIGTLGYMNDPTTINLCMVEDNYMLGDKKRARNTFHIKNYTITQAKEIYGVVLERDNDLTQYRKIVEKIIAECHGLPNRWVKTGVPVSIEIEMDNGYIDANKKGHIDYVLRDQTAERWMTVNKQQYCLCCGDASGEGESVLMQGCSAQAGKKYCSHCEELCESDEMRYAEDDNQYYCQDCIYTCDECHEYISPNNATYIEETYTNVCDDCLEEYYTKCDDCGDYINNDEILTTSNGYKICDNCYNYDYVTCHECNEIFKDDYNVKYTQDDRAYCRDCFDEKVVSCTKCNALYDMQDMLYDASEEPMCEECFYVDVIEDIYHTAYEHMLEINTSEPIIANQAFEYMTMNSKIGSELQRIHRGLWMAA